MRTPADRWRCWSDVCGGSWLRWGDPQSLYVWCERAASQAFVRFPGVVHRSVPVRALPTAPRPPGRPAAPACRVTEVQREMKSWVGRCYASRSDDNDPGGVPGP